MSIAYEPASFYERALLAAQSWPWGIGLSARRKLRRAWAPRTLAAFDADVARLGPGDIAIDFGANVGRFTRILAATGAEVHAYEPDPLTFARLTTAMADLPNVHLHQAAVGATSGMVKLHCAPQHRHAEHSETSSVVFRSSRHYDPVAVEVEQRAFGDVINGFDRPVSLIKMDIEGAEFDILRAILAAPQNFRFQRLYVETHESYAPQELPDVDRMRRHARALSGPVINLYWP
ncbi:MAG TPA: FkbM family methyltransferase [Paracoccaceae bacterium]|nr:FkbM family methyltransferase [Paracoccaceae bacterium]